MTTYTVNFWFKDRNLQRLYVNGPDRQALGYIERRQVERQRSTDSYYDRHRSMKGDTMEVVSDRITRTLPDDAYAALLEQIGKAADEAGVTRGTLTDADEIGVYFNLKNLVTAQGYMGDKAKMKKARKTFASTFRFEWN